MIRNAAAAVALALTTLAAAAGCAREQGVLRVVDGRTIEGSYIEPETYAMFLHGAMAEEQGDLVRAARAYAEAARRDPGDPEPWTRLGRVLCAMNATDKQADAAIAHALELDVDYAGAWAARAECATLRGKHDEANEAAARAAALEPAAADLQILWARASSQGERERSQRARDRLLALTLEHRGSAAAWEALGAWARTHGDVPLYAHAMTELAGRAPQKRDAIATAATLLAGDGELGAARAIAGALADGASAAGFGAPLGTRHALVARLAIDDAIALGDASRVRLRATRTHLGLEQAAGRALLLGRGALARTLAGDVLAADPNAACARMVLAASGDAKDPVTLRSAFASATPANGAVPAECVLAFARLVADALSKEEAARVVASVPREPLLLGDQATTALVVDLAARGVLPERELPLDALVELAARRGEAPPAIVISPPAGAPPSVDTRHEFLAVAMAEPQSPRARALGERLARVRDRDALVAVALARVELARVDGTADARAAASLLGFDPGDPLVAAAALDLAKKRGDVTTAARARASLSALARTPAERARLTE